jgi:hypothetical protein
MLTGVRLLARPVQLKLGFFASLGIPFNNVIGRRFVCLAL